MTSRDVLVERWSALPVVWRRRRMLVLMGGAAGGLLRELFGRLMVNLVGVLGLGLLMAALGHAVMA